MRKKILFISETTADKYHGQMLLGALAAAEEKNAILSKFTLESFFMQTRIEDQVDIFLSMVDDFKPDGVMFLGWHEDINRNLNRFISSINTKRSIPLMSVGKNISEVNSVSMDERSIREVITHLIEVHHYENIAFIQPIHPDERYGVYVEMMRERGLYNPDLVVTNENLTYSLDPGDQLKRAQLTADILFTERHVKIDAIITQYTDEAVYLLDELKYRGINVPGDVALTSWEDGDRGRYATPSVTSVYYPFYAHGYEGCRLLLEMIDGESVPRNFVSPGKFNVRRSCGCFPSHIQYADVDASSAAGYGIAGVLSEIEGKLGLLEPDVIASHFVSYISDRNDNAFMLYIEKSIVEHRCVPDYLRLIQKDILVFRSAAIRHFRDNAESIQLAENLWNKCHIFIGDNIEIHTGQQAVLDKGAEAAYREMMRDIVTTLDMEVLKRILGTGFLKTGISACMIFINSGEGRPFSRENCVLSYIDDTHEADVDTGNIVQDIMDNDGRYLYTVHLLNINKQLYGHILFRSEPCDDYLLNALAVQIGIAVHGTQILQDLNETNRQLSSAKDEIVRNLKIIEEKTSALEESNIKLSNLDQLKNDFIANITHDFRSPLMVILNSSDLGLRYDDPCDHDTMLKRYNTIASASIKLKESIDRLLDLAKMDARGLKLRIVKINLVKYFTSLIDYYRSAASLSSIRIDFKMPDNEIGDFYSDVDKLDEILHNIISNAFKFIDPVKGEITVSLIDMDDSIRIMVQDNGIGIQSDKLEVIFGRFEQLESRDSRKGTGIGLAFSRQLSEYLHGKIWAESDGPGKGSTFFLEFQKGNADAGCEPSSEDRSDSSEMQNRRADYENIIRSQIDENRDADSTEILITGLNSVNEFDIRKGLIIIVDDNQYIRGILKEYLSKNGFSNFILAANGKVGIEAIYKYRPDLIISDFNMPEMNGDEMHNALSSNPDFRHIPVIFLSAVTTREMVIERKRKGALAYLGKPVDETELVVTVESGLKKQMEYKQLILQATVDGLTGLANKITIGKFLCDKLMVRSYPDLSVIFIDLDHFKSINDTCGHPAGDFLLSETGKIIRSLIRAYDSAGRYGGEEFVIVLPDTPIDKAAIVAEKIRNVIEQHKMKYEGTEISITASFGVSSLRANAANIEKSLNITCVKDLFEVSDLGAADWDSIDDTKKRIADVLLNMADMALYEAKYTYCGSCGYHSENADNFINGKCSVCGSEDLTRGRNKVVMFGSGKC